MVALIIYASLLSNWPFEANADPRVATPILIAFITWILTAESKSQSEKRTDLFADISELEANWNKLKTVSGISNYIHYYRASLRECRGGTPSVGAGNFRRSIEELEPLENLGSLPTSGSFADIERWNKNRHSAMLCALGRARKLVDPDSPDRQVLESISPTILEAYQAWEHALLNLKSTRPDVAAIASLADESHVYVRYWMLLTLALPPDDGARTAAFHAAKDSMERIGRMRSWFIGSGFVARLVQRLGGDR